MPTIVRFKIPEKLHALEVGPDVFVFPEEATVGHWRAALKHWQNEGFIPHPRKIKQMIKIADALGLSDDVVLLPLAREVEAWRVNQADVVRITRELCLPTWSWSEGNRVTEDQRGLRVLERPRSD